MATPWDVPVTQAGATVLVSGCPPPLLASLLDWASHRGLITDDAGVQALLAAEKTAPRALATTARHVARATTQEGTP